MRLDTKFQARPRLSSFSEQHFSIYCPNFNQTLKLGFWDQHEEQEQEQEQQHNNNNYNETTFMGCDSIEINLDNLYYQT